jgi:hypothetical protein
MKNDTSIRRKESHHDSYRKRKTEREQTSFEMFLKEAKPAKNRSLSLVH